MYYNPLNNIMGLLRSPRFNVQVLESISFCSITISQIYVPDSKTKYKFKLHLRIFVYECRAMHTFQCYDDNNLGGSLTLNRIRNIYLPRKT